MSVSFSNKSLGLYHSIPLDNKTHALYTVVCVSACSLMHYVVTKLALPYMPQPKLWWSTLSSLSLGWSAPSPSSSTWGTGADLTQPPASPEAKVGDQSSCSVTKGVRLDFQPPLFGKGAHVSHRLDTRRRWKSSLQGRLKLHIFLRLCAILHNLLLISRLLI